MGYYIHPHSVEKVKGYLLYLLRLTEDNEVVFQSNEPNKLFYDLRQGLRAAKELNDEEFKDLEENVKLAVKKEMVIAVMKKKRGLVSVAVQGKVAPAMKTSSVETLLDLMDVMANSIDDEMYFPLINLSNRVVTWAEGKGYEISAHEDRGIIIRRNYGLELQGTQGS